MPSKKFEFFESAAECAAFAAPKFLARGWRWGGGDKPSRIPNYVDIMETLASLLEDVEGGQQYVETGRLCVCRVDEQVHFGVHRPTKREAEDEALRDV
jgi:hypothetical protein